MTSVFKTTITSKIQRDKLLENPQEISNVTKQFICDLCGFITNAKIAIIGHVGSCGKVKTKKRTNSLDAKCQWCNVQFGNHGNLTNHVRRAHGVLSYKSLAFMGGDFVCHICEKQFLYNYDMMYHVRKTHYNMTAKIPCAHKKKVNQVWFENVLNSNTIMEIKKMSQNKLIMKRLNEHTCTAVKVNNNSNDIIDVSHLYPTGKKRTRKTKCEICGIVTLQRCLSKHIAEKHQKLIKHRCNNCNRGFKRLYLYLNHTCKKSRSNGIRMGRQKERETDIHISSFESLAVPPKC